MNPNAISLLEKNLDKIDWEVLSMNPNAISLLEQNPRKIRWNCLSRNENGKHIMRKGPLSNHPYFNQTAISLLETNLDHSTVRYLKNYQDKIDWNWLSNNPNAIHLLKNKKNKILWDWLSSNPNAIPILERNPKKINWSKLSMNPGIFKLDYKFLENKIKIYKEELMMTVFHPRRFIRYLEMGYNMGDDTYEQDVKEI
jgi:ribosomal protein L24E